MINVNCWCLHTPGSSYQRYVKKIDYSSICCIKVIVTHYIKNRSCIFQLNKPQQQDMVILSSCFSNISLLKINEPEFDLGCKKISAQIAEFKILRFFVTLDYRPNKPIDYTFQFFFRFLYILKLRPELLCHTTIQNNNQAKKVVVLENILHICVRGSIRLQIRSRRHVFN